DHQILENSLVDEGRFINDADLKEYRKVAVIGIKVKEGLFKKENPIGKSIEVNGVAFKVVGVFKEEGRDGEEEEVVYLPITTAQKAFNGKRRVHQLLLTMGEVSVEESQIIEEQVRQKLAKKHRFSTKDRGALRISNRVEDYQEFKGVMTAIRVFIWFIASGTLLAGIIGVSNIMIIVVKERTKEIGVRKALGATPGTVVSLIMQEAILVTALAGYIGLLCGVVLLEVFSSGIWLEFLQSFGMMEDVSMDNMGIFYNPEVDLSVAVQATIFLVISGALAGWIPARRAARIRPIEALRYE
ncbi:MAG: ABC transporter permease, partial [Bacteroidota bacterium]